MSFFKRKFSQRSKNIITWIIVCIIIFGIFGFPYIVKSYYNTKIAAAGYALCMDHPVHHRRGRGYRGLLPYQVWVLDLADCDPGDDWSMTAYRRQTEALDQPGAEDSISRSGGAMSPETADEIHIP